MKKRKITTLLALQLMVLMYIASTVFYNTFDDNIGLIMNGITKYFLIASGLLVVFLFALEFKWHKPLVRTIILGFLLLLCVSSINTSLEKINALIWVSSIIYAIILVIANIRMLIFIKDDNNSNNKEIKSSTTYPPGILSEKHQKSIYLILILTPLLAIVILFAMVLLLHWNFAIVFPIVSLTAFVAILILVITTDPLNKTIKRFESDTNYDHLENDFNEFYQNNLHPETRNYLYLIKSNYLFTIDPSKGFEIFESVTFPQSENYKRVYDLIEVYYCINKRDHKSAEKSLTQFVEKYKRDNNIKRTKMMIKLIFTNEVIDDIDKIFTITNAKNLFVKMVNTSALMIYYLNRNNLDLAKKYATIILNENHNLTSYKEKAKEVLSM
ncbi:MAG: hypothetical protein RBQ97_04680 [Acholeplasma sp.]|nr:hypothetical protein [Acholeplasma sp.]